MKRVDIPTCLTTALLAAAISLPTLAQDATAPKKDEKSAGNHSDEAAMMASMMELAQPGQNHKLLENMVGSWTYKVKFWMSPDSPPMEATVTTMTKSTMGGRYFISEHNGKMQMPGPDGKLMDTEFKGMAVEGYDNAKKKYVASWIDNMGTGIMNSEGAYDPATKTLTYLSEYEPMPGMKTKVRQVIKIPDQDTHTMEFFELRRGGEVKTMEITYTRANKPKMRPTVSLSKTAE